MYEKYKNKQIINDESKHYELVRKYLLNHSSLAQSKKPILWIHMNYEINSRSWSSFGSRNNDHLNQPYMFLTIKSIIDKCGNDFNVCIIDDSTFNKIIPGWTIDLNMIAEPIRSKLRELAFARLLHSYGGLIVPRSFICLKNLKSIYEENIKSGSMFVGEFIDNTSTSVQTQYFPNSKLMGCQKNCTVMAEYIQFMEKLNSTDYTEESNFNGENQKWFYEKILQNKIYIINSNVLGMKDTLGKKITIDMLLNDSFIDIHNDCVGVYINEDEILNRNSYQWFSRLSTLQVLDSNTNIGKLLLILNDSKE